MTIHLGRTASSVMVATALAVAGADAARASVYVVGVSGSYTFDAGGVPGNVPLAGPVSFSGAFEVDTSASPIERLSFGGYGVTGYPDAAISNVSITTFGTNFSAADIVDQDFLSGPPGSAVYFSENLYAGATPAIWMAFMTPGGQSLMIGAVYCGLAAVPSCLIAGNLAYQDFTDPMGDVYLGGVSAVVATAPEPAAWALTLAGLGLAGARMRAGHRVSGARDRSAGVYSRVEAAPRPGLRDSRGRVDREVANATC